MSNIKLHVHNLHLCRGLNVGKYGVHSTLDLLSMLAHVSNFLQLVSGLLSTKGVTNLYSDSTQQALPSLYAHNLTAPHLVDYGPLTRYDCLGKKLLWQLNPLPKAPCGAGKKA
jgi:hypothetical protein